MNDQPKKRINPFDRVISVEPEVKKEEEVVETVKQPVYEEPIPHQNYESYNSNYNYNTPVQQPASRTPRKTQKTQYIQPIEAAKEKYTATMDVSLRRKIKIYCATNGRMFSEFIEEACKEKLAREGIR